MRTAVGLLLLLLVIYTYLLQPYFASYHEVVSIIKGHYLDRRKFPSNLPSLPGLSLVLVYAACQLCIRQRTLDASHCPTTMAVMYNDLAMNCFLEPFKICLTSAIKQTSYSMCGIGMKVAPLTSNYLHEYNISFCTISHEVLIIKSLEQSMMYAIDCLCLPTEISLFPVSVHYAFFTDYREIYHAIKHEKLPEEYALPYQLDAIKSPEELQIYRQYAVIEFGPALSISSDPYLLYAVLLSSAMIRMKLTRFFSFHVNAFHKVFDAMKMKLCRPELLRSLRQYISEFQDSSPPDRDAPTTVCLILPSFIDAYLKEVTKISSLYPNHRLFGGEMKRVPTFYHIYFQSFLSQDLKQSSSYDRPLDVWHWLQASYSDLFANLIVLPLPSLHQGIQLQDSDLLFLVKYVDIVKKFKSNLKSYLVSNVLGRVFDSWEAFLSIPPYSSIFTFCHAVLKEDKFYACFRDESFKHVMLMITNYRIWHPKYPEHANLFYAYRAKILVKYYAVEVDNFLMKGKLMVNSQNSFLTERRFHAALEAYNQDLLQEFLTSETSTYELDRQRAESFNYARITKFYYILSKPSPISRENVISFIEIYESQMV